MTIHDTVVCYISKASRWTKLFVSFKFTFCLLPIIKACCYKSSINSGTWRQFAIASSFMTIKAKNFFFSYTKGKPFMSVKWSILFSLLLCSMYSSRLKRKLPIFTTVWSTLSVIICHGVILKLGATRYGRVTVTFWFTRIICTSESESDCDPDIAILFKVSFGTGSICLPLVWLASLVAIFTSTVLEIN